MTTVSFDLVAEPRNDVGKGASRRLRRSGRVPAIIYGGEQPPQSLSLDHNLLMQQLNYEAFYSHILNVKVGGQTQRAVLRDLHRHPTKPTVVLHLDLQRVSESEAIHMHVPLHFVGEEVAPGVKQAGGIVSHEVIEVEVSCLPKDLPEYIEVDASGLNAGDALHLSDLKVPAGVTLVELARGPEHDQPVVAIHLRRGAAEEGEGAEEGGEAAEGGEA
ncbi:MAG TPA: 50S ribosomal protein L25/general stress protein Ctc [Gammaproteobacteria bacterium]|nr:50S ribosomal protein L25/general stress protein Ctc [Gammaproteobacteria bacterium]